MSPPNSSSNSASAARRNRSANSGATQPRSATAWVAMFCWRRQQQLTDALIDLLLQGFCCSKAIGYDVQEENERLKASLMTTLNPAVARVLKRLHYPLDVILTCVRWYVAYPLSLRHLEEMMAERGVSVDHSTVHRWAIKLLPILEKAFRRRKRPVGKSWRMDETYIKVKGQWKYLYRAVDKAGNTVDFLLRAHRDTAAARRYFEKSIDQNGEPETVTIDKSGANLAALEAINAERETPIKIRQTKYLNNIIEQDHRAIKRRTRPMLGFKDFRCARILLNGIELMHMIAKGQMKDLGIRRTQAEQFYSLVV
jgi:putative transposase